MLIVDGMNVIGAVPDGWWRDRRAAMIALVERLEAYAEAGAERVTVVFDGRPFGLGERRGGAVEVRFASRAGRDAADDDIAAIVAASSCPQSLWVATSDGDLARRVRALGAAVTGARELRRRLDAL